MKTPLKRTLNIGLGEVGLKAITAVRKKFNDTFEKEPAIIGYLGVSIEENPPEGIFAGEYLRIRPASDRLQQRAIFIEESSAALRGMLKNSLDRICYVGIDEGEDWTMLSFDSSVCVNILYSLSDIVGSALCIDVAFLLRAMFGDRITISMHTVLSGLSESFGKRHAANAYATLQDLDYLNASTSYERPFCLNIPGESYQIQRPPMDTFYLIGTGEQCLQELASEVYVFTLLSKRSSLENNSIRQLMIEGSFDVEEKKAWISIAKAASFRFIPPYSIDHKEEILKESLEAVKLTTQIDGKGYNNLASVFSSVIISGPEDELTVLKQEPRLNTLLVFPEDPWIQWVDNPFKEIVIMRLWGVYPAFQVAGWDCELAYYSYEDHKPFHFDESVYDLMYASHFSLTPNVTITDDELWVYIKSRLWGLISDDTSLEEAYANRRELRSKIYSFEKEEPDKADAIYEAMRHLKRDEFNSRFPCPDDIADAAFNYATQVL